MLLLAPASRALRHLALGALLALGAAPVPGLVASAHAAAASVPVVLPAGQKAEDWADALAARGLVAVRGPLAETGPGVVIVDQRDYWVMTIRDRAGQTQSVNVAPAGSASEREDLVFYLSTFLGPAPEEAPPAPVALGRPPPLPPAVGPVAVATPAAPPVAAGTPAAPPVAAGTPAAPPPVAVGTPAAPPPAATSRPPASSPVAVGAPPPKPAPPAQAAAPKPTTSTATTTGASAAPAGPGTGLWLGAGGGVGLRADVATVGDLRVDGGWHLTPALRVGVGLAGRTEAALTSIGEGRAMSDIDVVAEGAYVIDLGAVRPLVGVYGGLSARAFTKDGVSVTDAVLPILGGELGAQIGLGSLPIHLEPSVRIQGDLRSVELLSATGTSVLAPVEVRAGLLIGYRAK
jgi:hypothetical protein